VPSDSLDLPLLRVRLFPLFENRKDFAIDSLLIDGRLHAYKAWSPVRTIADFPFLAARAESFFFFDT